LGSVLRVAANAEFNFVQMTGVDNIPDCAEKYAITVVNNYNRLAFGHIITFSSSILCIDE